MTLSEDRRRGLQQTREHRLMQLREDNGQCGGNPQISRISSDKRASSDRPIGSDKADFPLLIVVKLS